MLILSSLVACDSLMSIKRVTQLELEKNSAAYLRRLSAGLGHFRAWLLAQGIAVAFTRQNRRNVDDALAHYVQACFLDKISMALPKHAILAVQKLLDLRRQLPRAWAAFRSWSLRAPAQHRVPVPFEFLQLMFLASLNGFLAGSLSPLALPFAVLLRVAFFGLLRPCEVFKLKVRDVRIGYTSKNQPVATLILRDPKNRASMGVNQFVLLQDGPTVLWLSWVLLGLQPDHHLWPSSGLSFRQMFADVAADCGLSFANLVPAGLRAGGATWMFTEGVSIGHLQFCGRWKSQTSLHSYIQEAMACLVWLDTPPSVHQLRSATAKLLRLVWSSPPSRPRASFGPLPLGWRRIPRQSPQPPGMAPRGCRPQ